MTTKERVRQKIIETFGEDACKYHCGFHQDVQEHCTSCEMKEFGLADVLRAINTPENAKKFWWGVDCTGEFIDIDGPEGGGTDVFWNLRQDDLEAQSDEVVEFLAKVLGVETL